MCPRLQLASTRNITLHTSLLYVSVKLNSSCTVSRPHHPTKTINSSQFIFNRKVCVATYNLHLIVVTQARVHCLICTYTQCPRAHSARERTVPESAQCSRASSDIRMYQAMHKCLCYNYYVTLPLNLLNL